MTKEERPGLTGDEFKAAAMAANNQTIFMDDDQVEHAGNVVDRFGWSERLMNMVHGKDAPPSIIEKSLSLDPVSWLCSLDEDEMDSLLYHYSGVMPKDPLEGSPEYERFKEELCLLIDAAPRLAGRMDGERRYDTERGEVVYVLMIAGDYALTRFSGGLSLTETRALEDRKE